MRASTRSDYLDRVRRVLRHVQEHLDEELSPDDLAQVAHFSRFHFHRVFRGIVGESIGEHLRRLRLERASGELRRTDRSVLDIALDAGYEAHEAFTRAFRGHFGVAPSEYRAAPEPIVFPHSLCGVHYGADEAVSRFVPLQEDSHMIDVKFEMLPPRRLLARPHAGDYQGIGAAFELLYGFAFSQGLIGPDSVSLGIYYDDPDATPVEKLRSHACLTVPASFGSAPEGYELLELEGGEHAIGIHRGPYEGLHQSYRWLFGQWLPSSGREPANRAVHEIYVNDPRTTAPADLITHICVPLQPVVRASAGA